MGRDIDRRQRVVVWGGGSSVGGVTSGMEGSNRRIVDICPH